MQVLLNTPQRLAVRQHQQIHELQIVTSEKASSTQPAVQPVHRLCTDTTNNLIFFKHPLLQRSGGGGGGGEGGGGPKPGELQTAEPQSFS